ncbi:hypothetical protein AK830_g4245 [Neonectria ditissima]|uniref:Uncharacterized protein n=1 Tax=Neonectria ditissima TaxID=78410 RepID=A0A0P7BGF3_9HYPO|nr:hypothetical protein AK830_g4245 [Neonectria ditissima]
MIQLCNVHRKLMLRSPRSKPTTIYSVLDLDPHTQPFYPPELASTNGSREAIESQVTAAYNRHSADVLQRLNSDRRDAESDDLQRQQHGSYRVRREEQRPLSPAEPDEEWSDIVTQAAAILLSSELRNLYDTEFLPVLTQSSVPRSEETISNKKRVKLRELCYWTEGMKSEP